MGGEANPPEEPLAAEAGAVIHALAVARHSACRGIARAPPLGLHRALAGGGAPWRVVNPGGDGVSRQRRQATSIRWPVTGWATMGGRSCVPWAAGAPWLPCGPDGQRWRGPPAGECLVKGVLSSLRQAMAQRGWALWVDPASDAAGCPWRLADEAEAGESRDHDLGGRGRDLEAGLDVHHRRRASVRLDAGVDEGEVLPLVCGEDVVRQAFLASSYCGAGQVITFSILEHAASRVYDVYLTETERSEPLALRR